MKSNPKEEIEQLTDNEIPHGNLAILNILTLVVLRTPRLKIE